MPDDHFGLFREEAVAARRGRIDGQVFLPRSTRIDLVTGAVTLSIVAIAIWIGLGSYSRTETAKGVIATDLETAKVIALHAGIVAHVAVVEGQQVSRGQLLATVRLDQQYALHARAAQDGLDAARIQEKMSEQQVAAVRARGKSERAGLAASLAGAREQLSNITERIAIQQSVVQSLERVLERYKPIAARGFISGTEMDAREQQVLTAQEQLSSLQQQRITLKSNISGYITQSRSSLAEENNQTSGASASAQGYRSQQSQLLAQQYYVITAPISGEITALQAGDGRTVDSTVPLMTIVPRAAKVHAEVFAPSRAVGFVKRGDEVRLLFDAFPYQRFGTFGGRITSISRVALDPRQADAPFKIDEPVYRLRVAPDRQMVSGYGENIELQPGMTLTANIILERRSFFGWLIEPLNAVVKRDR